MVADFAYPEVPRTTGLFVISVCAARPQNMFLVLRPEKGYAKESRGVRGVSKFETHCVTRSRSGTGQMGVMLC